MTRIPLIVGIALLAVTADVHAQADATTLVPGARVRVHQGPQSLTGSLVSLDSAGLVVATGKSDTAAVPLSSITGVDVSRGTKSRVGKGALIGLGVGTATGIIIGVAASSSDDGDFFDFNSGEWAIGVGLTGAVIGTGIGAIIGATQRTDKWQPTVLPTVSVRSYGPDDKRVAIGLQIGF